MKAPKEVSQAELKNIIETKKPKGLFYHVHENKYDITAVDNSIGEAWTEDFESLDLCIKWLNGEIEV